MPCSPIGRAVKLILYLPGENLAFFIPKGKNDLTYENKSDFKIIKPWFNGQKVIKIVRN